MPVTTLLIVLLERPALRPNSLNDHPRFSVSLISHQANSILIVPLNTRPLVSKTWTSEKQQELSPHLFCVSPKYWLAEQG